MEAKKYSVRFLAIEVLEKLLSPPPNGEIGSGQSSDYRFNYLIDLKLETETKKAAVLTDITIMSNSEEKLAFLKTICVFEIKEFNEIFIPTKDNKLQIPVDIEILLKTAGLSTSRGILFSELKGTYLHYAILPLMDLASQIWKDHEDAKKTAK